MADPESCFALNDSHDANKRLVRKQSQPRTSNIKEIGKFNLVSINYFLLLDGILSKWCTRRVRKNAKVYTPRQDLA